MKSALPNPNPPSKKELLKLIKSGKPSDYAVFLKEHHEADIAEGLETLPPQSRHHFFKKINPEITADILEEMKLEQQLQIISTLKISLAAKYIEEMNPDDAVDLLEELQEENEIKAQKIIKALPQKEAHELTELLSYPEDSAGALMTPEVISLPENLTIQEAINSIKKKKPPNSEISFYSYIVNKNNELLGYATLRDILLQSPKKKIKEIRNNHPISVHVLTDQEEVAKLFQKYDVIALPVVNDNNQLMGLITVDDIVDVVVEEATEDLYKLSGTSDIDENKLLSGNIFHSIISRSPWLLLTIVGGILASVIITKYADLYDAALFPLALSLSFIPMLMGLGGNVGNQSATIIVRGLSTGHLKNKPSYYHITREIIIGFIIGCLVGGSVFIFNIITKQSILFSGIVSLSLITNITVASLIGTSLPLLFNKLKIDPAVASAPFISTALDLIGQLIYFSLTLLIISYLGG